MAVLVDFATAQIQGFEADGAENSVFRHTKAPDLYELPLLSNPQAPHFKSKNGPCICEPNGVGKQLSIPAASTLWESKDLASLRPESAWFGCHSGGWLVGLVLNFRFARNSLGLRQQPGMPFHDMFGNGPLMDDPIVERIGADDNLSGTQFAVTRTKRPRKKVKK